MDTNMSDQRKVWPLAGYAPGGYTCKCTDCGEGFEGDKRAVQCLDCAIIWANKQILSPSRLSANDEGVTVKALEWDRDSKPGLHFADTYIGTYQAFADGTLSLDFVQLSHKRRTWHETEAAAQADYERRILSALSTKLEAHPETDWGPDVGAEVLPSYAQHPTPASGDQMEVVAVKRWSPIGYGGMMVDPQGEFVHFSDLDAATKAIADRDAEIERLRDAETNGVGYVRTEYKKRIAQLEKALARHREGWTNVLELDLLPKQHRQTAEELRDHAHAAIRSLEGK